MARARNSRGSAASVTTNVVALAPDVLPADEAGVAEESTCAVVADEEVVVVPDAGLVVSASGEVVETEAVVTEGAGDLSEGVVPLPTPSAVASVPNRLTALLYANAGVAKTHVGSQLRMAAQVESEAPPLMSTGNWALDRCLGGGLCPGRWHTFYGVPSSGKTFSVLKTIATFQQCCARCYAHRDDCRCKQGVVEPVCLLVLTEDWPYGWASAIGVDLDRLVLSSPASGEEALDQIDVLMRTGNVDLICLDSLAYLTPLAEIQASVAAKHMGVSARLIGQGIRKIAMGFKYLERDGLYPTVLVTNQTRVNLAVQFSDNETKPGGASPGFAATTETRFGKAKVSVNAKTKEALFADCHIKVRKSKQSDPLREGEFRILFADAQNKKRGEIVDESLLVEDARSYGLIEEVGGKKWRYDKEIFPSLAAVIKAVTTTGALRRKMMSELIYLMRP